jgi:xanthine dehydrogenase YagR molybdenum-binding subunit
MSTSKTTKSQNVLYGIVGDGLTQVARQVPLDEPPALPKNDELTVIGKPVQRMDAVLKVTGRARYSFDVQLPGMLYGRQVVSTVAHARVKSIDTSEAERYPGVRAVHILDTVLMNAQLRDPQIEAKERYPLVRYVGQPIAGIAATSSRAATEAAK